MQRIRGLFSGVATVELADRVGETSRPLEGVRDLAPLLERIGGARCVLLGEASHGTSEYYARRARISERLIREKGFSTKSPGDAMVGPDFATVKSGREADWALLGAATPSSIAANTAPATSTNLKRLVLFHPAASISSLAFGCEKMPHIRLHV